MKFQNIHEPLRYSQSQEQKDWQIGKEEITLEKKCRRPTQEISAILGNSTPHELYKPQGAKVPQTPDVIS